MKRILAALVLLPLCYGMALALWQLLRPFKEVPEGSFYFFAGMAAYAAFQWALFRPMRTYVFGHELTHALAAWLSGAQVKRFHVGKRGGSVTVTKSNIFVSLSPYILPLYSLLLLGGYCLAVWGYPPVRAYWRIFLILLGASFAFHMALTVYALKQDQPDLKPSGRFLSAVVIFLGNAVSVAFLFGVLFPNTVSWRQFALTTGVEAITAVEQVGRGTAVVVQEAMEKVDDLRDRN